MQPIRTDNRDPFFDILQEISDDVLDETPDDVLVGPLRNENKGVTGAEKRERTYEQIEEGESGKAAKIHSTGQSIAVTAPDLAHRSAPAAALLLPISIPKMPHLGTSRQLPKGSSVVYSRQGNLRSGKRAHEASEKEPSKAIRGAFEQSNLPKDLPTPKQFSGFCKRGNFTKVKEALEAGFNIHTPLDVGRPDLLPVHLNQACAYGHVEIVLLLIQYGADVNESNGHGETPLHKACMGGHLEVIRRLIEQRSDVNSNKSHRTPLHEACLRGSLGIVQLLILSGADVNLIDQCNATPLHFACEKGDLEIIRVLVTNGADVNKTNRLGETPLQRACWNGHLEVARLLITNKADLKVTDLEGKTALHKACRNGHAGVVQFLLEAGADVHKADRRKWTPLHEACWHGGDFGDVELFLLAKGADANATDLFGATPLHSANSVATKLLIQSGADVNKQSLKGNAPLHYACRGTFRGGLEIARLLLEHGADPALTNKAGQTPFQCALNPEEFKAAVMQKCRLV